MPTKQEIAEAQVELADGLVKLAQRRKLRYCLALDTALLERIAENTQDKPCVDGYLLQALWEALPIFPEKMLGVQDGR